MTARIDGLNLAIIFWDLSQSLRRRPCINLFQIFAQSQSHLSFSRLWLKYFSTFLLTILVICYFSVTYGRGGVNPLYYQTFLPFRDFPHSPVCVQAGALPLRVIFTSALSTTCLCYACLSYGPVCHVTGRPQAGQTQLVLIYFKVCHTFFRVYVCPNILSACGYTDR